ncbi:hypothetical protein BDR22DRAFT_821500 [Usnea florida]
MAIACASTSQKGHIIPLALVTDHLARPILRSRPGGWERSSEAYDRIGKEKSPLTSLKKQARGIEKNTPSKRTGVLELREGLIQMRNQKVTMVMRQKYKTLTQDNTPIRSTLRSNNLSGYGRQKHKTLTHDNTPLVEVIKTGIPHPHLNWIANSAPTTGSRTGKDFSSASASRSSSTDSEPIQMHRLRFNIWNSYELHGDVGET